MNRIDQQFALLKSQNKKGLIVYITAGDPSLKITQELVMRFCDRGVDFIELGVPFSDPLADGATNQLAAMRALKSKTNIKKILKIVDVLRRKITTPLIIFTYLNPILQYGYEKFARDSKKAGIDGVLVLDLPIEEADEFQFMMNRYNLKTIFLVTPTSELSRIKKIAAKASGFIYCVSRTGVTGLRKDLPKEVPGIIGDIRKFTPLPIAVGFGISGPVQAKAISKLAEAVVVGSAIVKKIEENIGKKDLIQKVSSFVEQLLRAVHG